VKVLQSIIELVGNKRKKLVPPIILSCIDSMLNSAMYFIMFLVLIALADNAYTKVQLVRYSWAMLLVLVARIVVQAVAFTIAQCTGADISYDLRMRLGNHLCSMNLGFFNQNSVGRLSGILLTDVTDFEAIITHCLCDAVKTLAFLFMAVIVAFLLDIRYGILTLLVIGIAFPLLLSSGRVSAQQAVERKKANHSADTKIIEYISGLRTFRLYNMIGSRFEGLDNALQRLKEESVKSELRVMPRAVSFSAVVGFLIPGALLLGAHLYETGEVNTPVFLIMVLLSVSVSSMMNSASALYPQFCTIEKSAESIHSILDQSPIPYTSDHFALGDGKISFEHVSFSYGETEVLKDISFSANPGSVTALVGPSGAGKTTIVSLLARFWDTSSGRITINGTDIRNINPEVLASHMSIVFQDVYLFADTIYNNIKIGNPEATREQIIQASKAARCHDFIMQKEAGYDTLVGEGGSTLSGGERQRIAIARALVRNAPIVLLDETTSNLDAENEKEIECAFEQLMKQKTVVVIAHRLNTIAHADQILVMKNGTIAECGTHESLMHEEHSWYQNMVQQQKMAEQWNIKTDYS
jgi:ATP-binding cassette subfamily B protein IrtB